MSDAPAQKRRPLFEFIGWLPAVFIPAATIAKLVSVMVSETVDKSSVWSWLLFGLANICFYIYTEKYRSPQAILGFLGTALLDFIIVGAILVRAAA